MINLQKTPMDKYCSMVIHGKCDDVIELLMQKLGYQIPNFTLKRRLRVTHDESNNRVTLMGVDSNGANYTMFKNVNVKGLGAKPSEVHTFPEKKV